ncbi:MULTISPECIES: LysR family transcriptional regulator [unclassified Duganella]|jgi:DNA-binding transcriptional LysR family regulator|uniref:LysR family transcriptional regulator n=1 Tax=unclassified Duganella TaxID=2636909 RepID=UPI00088D953A|nr:MULTISPECIES: LysR family transcriptional regulator [unclassified Duganella]SDG60048.1 DNA-binding transcriptional regulator, LysR family [Duganella sp. OV458]SDJ83317.1 DNA-binding transcriptional regulator, LysR family [Duganella sp. OV510]
MDRLLSMTVFAKAVELGSFSAAADAFRMSPQLVGKHVQMLEQHLGVRLLNRTTRRQHLTEIGANYYEKVKVILAEVESAEGLAAESKARPSGRLRINAPVSFGIHALMPRLTDYMAAYPEVQVEVSLANRYVDALEEGADAVFRVGELSDSSRIARRLAPYRLILCAAPAYLNAHPPIKSPPDLASHECLGFAYTELRTHWSFNGPEGLVTVPVSGRLMIDSGEALLMAARAGMGVLLQPAELIEPELEAGRLVRVLPKYRPPDRPLHLLYAPDRQMTPKLRSFIEFAVAAFGTHKA